MVTTLIVALQFVRFLLLEFCDDLAGAATDYRLGQARQEIFFVVHAGLKSSD